MPYEITSDPLKFLFIHFLAALAVFVVSDAMAAMKINADKPATKYANEPIRPIPLKVDEDPRIVALGRKLFEDPRLSADNSVSCSTCHPLDRAGVDGLTFSIGINGQVSHVNTPTVFNSILNFAQFWDGRAGSLEEQAASPITNPREMASNWDQVILKIQADDSYRKAFSEIYPEGITKKTITGAIAIFEHTLITPNSRFDRFLKGEEEIITDNEKQGYRLFKSYGCVSCHQGVGVGGNMFEKMGVFADYFTDKGTITEADYGRFNVTGIEEHRFEFKVPSLRNVALTAPYFHDGSAKTLEEAVTVMAKHQLGRSLKPEDIKRITAFLGTLSGEFGQ